MKKIISLLLISAAFFLGGDRGDAFEKGHAAETSEEAIKWYQKALSLCREDEKIPRAWAYNNIGFVLLKDSEWNEALGWFEKAVKEDDSNHVAWNNLGMTYENIGFFKKTRPNKRSKTKAAVKEVTGETAGVDPEVEYLNKALTAYKKSLALKPDEDKYKINKLRVESLLQVR